MEPGQGCETWVFAISETICFTMKIPASSGFDKMINFIIQKACIIIITKKRIFSAKNVFIASLDRTGSLDSTRKNHFFNANISL